MTDMPEKIYALKDDTAQWWGTCQHPFNESAPYILETKYRELQDQCDKLEQFADWVLNTDNINEMQYIRKASDVLVEYRAWKKSQEERICTHS